MMDLNIILYILVCISLAEFSIQVVISELSNWLKDKIGINQPYKLGSLSKVRFWKQLFGKGWIFLSPLVFVLILFFSCHRFVSSLVGCPYCTCFWLALATNHFYFGMDIITSLLLAPLALAAVAGLDKLHSN